MISDTKAIEILERLLKKSRANQVNWQRGASWHLANLSDAHSFVVVLPESSIEISFQSPETDPDCFVVSFKNKAGVTVKTIVLDEDSKFWGLAQSLFDEGGRIAVGWDRVLDDIETAVSSHERIGIPKEK